MPVTKNLRDATVSLIDGSSPPLKCVLVSEEGDASWTEQDNIIQVKDRGSLSHMREGDEEPVEGSMTLKFIEFLATTGASMDPTPYSVLKGNSSFVSTAGAGEPFAVDLDMVIVDPSAADNERIRLSKLHATQVEFSEGDEYNTLSFEFTAYVTEPTVSKTSCTQTCQASCQTGCETGCETSSQT